MSPVAGGSTPLKAHSKLFRIGVVSSRSGLSVKTIRFYCDQGLLHPSLRTEAGYRLFDESVFAELDMIRRLRAIELPLATVKETLEARRKGLCSCSNLQTTIREKSLEIRQRLADMEAIHAELEQMLSSWESCGGRDIRSIR